VWRVREDTKFLRGRNEAQMIAPLSWQTHK
jgi:hypothetical protein